MRGLPYYENPEYHQYLLSPQRRELFPIDKIFSQINWKNKKNVLDFGMGNGYYLPGFFKYGDEDIFIWGAECQEILIDYCLKRKVKEGYKNFIPFFIERTEHPLLPEWIPEMDMIFCSCVLSTFANPSLGISGTARILKNDGIMVIIDWERVEAPSGPELTQKVSSDRMKFFIEEAGCTIIQKLNINPYVYGFIIKKDPDKFTNTIDYIKDL